jgi:single-strand DNA-binding protein
MAMSTAFTITGNLAADPELRYTPSGKAIVKFVVISNERYRDPHTGNWADGQRTDVRVTAWEALAENTAESLHKGSRVTVTGHRVEAHAWIGETDQAAHAVLELTADEVQVGLRWHIVTAQKTTRTPAGGDGEVEGDAREAAQVLRGAEERRTEPGRPDDLDELAEPMAVLREQLGAVPAEPDGGAS